MLKSLAFFWSAVAAEAAFGGAMKRVEFVQEFHPAEQDLVELWVPTPLEQPGYQKVISREFQGNATVLRFGTEAAGPAPYVYVRWEKVKAPSLRIINVVEIQDRDGVLPGGGDAQEFLGASQHVQTDGIVAETSAKIVAGKKTSDDKARAIYDWIVEKTARDPETRGCGLGDVRTTLTSGSLKGKCADLNSLFVGLARAAGVPAREVFGQRVAASAVSPSLGKEGDNSKAQHCRAEYYSSEKRGWVPVDPADVRKLILEEKLTLEDPKVQAARARFFGSWEGSWVAYNFARDFKLEGYGPQPLNFFMYPLLAAAKIRPDGVDPQQTGYAFRTRVIQ